MQELSEKLTHSLQAWQEWAQSAEKEESGWESEAPNWQELVTNAQDLRHRGLPFLGCSLENMNQLTRGIKSNSDRVTTNGPQNGPACFCAGSRVC